MSATEQTAVIVKDPQPVLMRVYLYRSNPNDPLGGTLKFQGKHGEVEIRIDDAAARKVVDIMSEGVRGYLAEIAEALRGEFRP